MIQRVFLGLALLGFQLECSAAPKDLSLYFGPSFGLVTLSDGSVIEGSKEFGGITPDFLVDWNSAQFDELKKFCRKIKSENKDLVTVTNEIRQYLNLNVFLKDAKSAEYNKVISLHKKDNLAPLSEFMIAKAGSCREHAYILHLALKEAGVPNKLAYVKIPEIISNSNDHAIIVYQFDRKWRGVDATSDAFKDAWLDTILQQGKITHLNLFPRVWNPRQSEFLRALHQYHSSKEFKSALYAVIRRIPDLKEVWMTAERNHLKIKLGGGVVRGVIRWMLSHPGQLTPPASSELLLNKKADRDIFVPRSQLRDVKSIPELQGWEVSVDSEFEESIQAGGTALDKVRAGLQGIDDPLGALDAFYVGELQYVIKSDEELEKTFWFKHRNNTKTAMILRAIRVWLDFPELKISDSVIQYFKTVAMTEQISHQKSSEEFHWIQKALNKIFEASYDDAVTTVSELRKYGFLKKLSDNGYQLRLDSALVPVFEELEGLGWSLSEIQSAKNLFNTSFDSILSISEAAFRATTYEATIKILRRGLLFAKSPEDYIHLYSASKSGLVIEAKAKEQVFMESMDSFLALNPRVDQVIQYLKVVQVSDAADKIMYLKMVNRINTIGEYIQLLEPMAESTAHDLTRAQVCLETLDLFFSKHPQVTEIRELIDRAKFPDASRVDLEIFMRGAQLTSSIDEYINMLLPFEKYNSAAFQEYRSQAALNTISHFFSLHPNTTEVERLLDSGRFNDQVDQEIIFRAERLYTDKSAFDALLKRYPKVVRPTWIDRCWRKLVRKR